MNENKSVWSALVLVALFPLSAQATTNQLVNGAPLTPWVCRISTELPERIQALQRLLRDDPGFAADLISSMSADPEFARKLGQKSYMNADPWLLYQDPYSASQWTRLTSDPEFMRLVTEEMEKKHVDPWDIREQYHKHGKAALHYYFDQIHLPEGGEATLPFGPTCNSDDLLEVMKELSTTDYVASVRQYEGNRKLNSKGIRDFRMAKVEELVEHLRAKSGHQSSNTAEELPPYCDSNDDLRKTARLLSTDEYVSSMISHENAQKMDPSQIRDFRMAKIQELIANLQKEAATSK